MDGNQLFELISERWSLLRELLEISERQMAAIEAGAMSKLMRLLSDKQKPLARLGSIASELRDAADDDPETRVWPDEETRVACRQRQEECEKMHLQLLAVEAECETALQQNRHSIAERIDRVESGRRAATTYASAPNALRSGGQLDLSSD